MARLIPVDHDPFSSEQIQWVSGPTPMPTAGAEPESLTSYSPTWRDKIGAALIGGGRPSPEWAHFVEGMVGSRGLGSTGPSLVDVMPVGAAFGAQEALRAGDPQGAAMAILPTMGGFARTTMREGGAALRGLSPPANDAMRMRPASGLDLPPPLTPLERNWQNYGKRMSPDDVLTSEAVWGHATRGAEAGLGRAESFAQAANDLWQRMGANRYVSPDMARRYIAQEESRMRGFTPPRLVPVDHDPFVGQ